MNDVIKRMKNSKFLTILLSVLIACILWVYVVNANDPDIKDTIRNIPITVSGQSALKEKGLIITEMSSDDLDIRLVGKRNALVNLNNKNIPVTVDVSGISSAGSYELLCNITLPLSATGGGVTVNNQENYLVTVDVEKRASKTLEISGVFTGSVAKGYQGGTFSVSPSSIEISGPESLIKSIKSAQVTLDETGLKQTFSGELPIELINAEDKVVSIEKIESKITSAHAVYPVSLLKKVTLEVDLLSGGGAMPEDVICEIFPKSILISGPESVLLDMQAFSVGEIDLTEITGDTIILLPIRLPDDLVNESGIEEAKISIRFENLVKKTFEVSQFELKNVPEGYVAGIVSTSVPVTVRGTAAAVASMRADRLSIEIDLADTEPAEGEIEVLATVVMDELEGVGVVGTVYSAWIALTK